MIEFENPPAFPRQHSVADANDPAFKLGADGMTLRDYFAAKAMASMVGNQIWVATTRGYLLKDGAQELGISARGYEMLANQAYEIADAMLRARRA